MSNFPQKLNSSGNGDKFDDYMNDNLDEEEQLMMQQMNIGANSHLLRQNQVKQKSNSSPNEKSPQKPITQQNNNNYQPPQYQDEYDDEDDYQKNNLQLQKSEFQYRKTQLPQQNKQNEQQQQNQKKQDKQKEDEEEEEYYDEEDEDEDMQEQDVKKMIHQLVTSINQEPYEFQNYQQLIEIYRANGMLDEVREVRERVHQLYCLPVVMWIEWIEDEQRSLTPNESPSKILELCKTALNDYRYYKVSKKYCRLLIQLYELQQGEVDEQQVRDGFEKVLQIYGLDVNRSVKFWEPYLDFEKNQLNKLVQRQISLEEQLKLYPNPSLEQKLTQLQEDIQKQTHRLRSIYRRRVIFPTMDMFVIWSEYEQWEIDDGELQRQRERYVQANERINEVVNFEEKFQNAYQDLENNNDIEQMINLLSKDLETLAQDNFNYIMLYFERILSEYTLNLDLWKIYINYTDDKCKQKQIKQEIYEKAVKNCPQEYEFWLGYMRELEKNESTAEQIINAANQALQNGSFEVSIQFQYEIFKFLCEYSARQLIVVSGVKPNLENAIVLQQVQKIRAMYQDSIDNIKEQNKDDPLLQFFTEKLQLGWAEVEAYKIQDKKQVQDLMEEYVKKNGQQMIAWANYIKLMRVFQDNEKTLRGLFKRGLQFTKDNKVVLGELWLEWEKKFSTIQNVDQCIKHLKKLNLYGQIGKPTLQNQQQSQNQKEQAIIKDDQTSQQNKNAAQSKQNKRKDGEDSQLQKRKNPEPINEKIKDQKTQKRQKTENLQDQKDNNQQKPTLEEQKENQKRNKRTLYLSELSETTEEEDIEDLFKRIVPEVSLLDIRLIRNESGEKRGYAYVDVATYEMAEKSLKLNNYNLKGKMLKIHIYKPPEGERNDFTVYVNNLPFTCDEKRLEDHFKQIGPIREIRIKRELSGKIKGYAYVEFVDKFSVKKAIEQLNKSKLDNRTISVEECKSKQDALNKYGFTVHFRNLDYKIEQEVLRQYFEEHFGEVKRMILTQDDKGRSMGYGNVEFVEEQSMQKALQQKEIRDLGKRIGIMQRSLRQITQPNTQKETEYAQKQKKREAKQERKTLLNSMINEIKNEKTDQIENQLVESDQNSHEGQKQEQPKVEVNKQINNSKNEEEMSNEDFKKMLLGRRR